MIAAPSGYATRLLYGSRQLVVDSASHRSLPDMLSVYRYYIVVGGVVAFTVIDNCYVYEALTPVVCANERCCPEPSRFDALSRFGGLLSYLYSSWRFTTLYDGEPYGALTLFRHRVYIIFSRHVAAVAIDCFVDCRPSTGFMPLLYTLSIVVNDIVCCSVTVYDGGS